MTIVVTVPSGGYVRQGMVVLASTDQPVTAGDTVVAIIQDHATLVEGVRGTILLASSPFSLFVGIDNTVGSVSEASFDFAYGQAVDLVVTHYDVGMAIVDQLVAVGFLWDGAPDLSGYVTFLVAQINALGGGLFGNVAEILAAVKSTFTNLP
jgi:hypothetical protein